MVPLLYIYCSYSNNLPVLDQNFSLVVDWNTVLLLISSHILMVHWDKYPQWVILFFLNTHLLENVSVLLGELQYWSPSKLWFNTADTFTWETAHGRLFSCKILHRQILFHIQTTCRRWKQICQEKMWNFTVADWVSFATQGGYVVNVILITWGQILYLVSWGGTQMHCNHGLIYEFINCRLKCPPP